MCKKGGNGIMAIEVKDLTFAYPKSNNNALEHISVIIEKGERWQLSDKMEPVNPLW